MTRRRQLQVVLATLVLAAPLGACSALVGFSGLAGDPPVTGDAEAGIVVDTGTDAAMSADAGATDAYVAMDATTVPPRFCADASGTALCDDFDDPDGSFSRWTYLHVGMGALGVDPDASVSAPASLLSTCTGGGMNNGVGLTKNLSGHTRVLVAADLRLDSVDGLGYGSLLEVHLSPLPSGFGDYRVALIYSSSQMTLDVYAVNDEGGTTQIASTIAKDFSSFRRIAIELAMLPTPHAAAYDETGTLLKSISMPAFAGSDTSRSQTVTVGLPYLTANVQPWSAHLDNVTITILD